MRMYAWKEPLPVIVTTFMYEQVEIFWRRMNGLQANASNNAKLCGVNVAHKIGSMDIEHMIYVPVKPQEDMPLWIQIVCSEVLLLKIPNVCFNR